MLETPEIVQLPEQQIARIRLKIPKADIQKEMGPGIQELMSTVAGQGIKATGPWFTHHNRILADGWDYEICVPVSAPVSPQGRVRPATRPALKAARAVLKGNYDQLPRAWPELDAWVKKNGHAAREDLYEIYAVGPEAGSDPGLWRTELLRPIA